MDTFTFNVVLVMIREIMIILDLALIGICLVTWLLNKRKEGEKT